MQANEIRDVILSTRNSMNCTELFVDDVVKKGIERNSVVLMMKQMSDKGEGKFIAGRKGGRSRFLFGQTMIEEIIDPSVIVLANALKRLIDKKLQIDPDQQIIIYVEDLKDKFALKNILLACKILEKDNIGLYIPGRRGGKSRFEVGRKREDKFHKTRSSGSEYDLPLPEDGPFSNVENETENCECNDEEPNTNIGYTIRTDGHTIFLQNNIKGGYSTIDEAIKSYKKFANITKLEMLEIKNQLVRFGCFIFT